VVLVVLELHHQFLVLQSPMLVAVAVQLMLALEMVLVALEVAVLEVLRLLAEQTELPI
jgi:hypothetical protein